MPTRDELIDKCSEIYSKDSGPYESARQWSINNLNATGELDDESLFTFRTVLRDMGEFFEHLNSGNTSDAETVLNDIEEDLQEAACESAKRTAEYHLSRISHEIIKYPILYRVLFLSRPDNLNKKIDRIKQRIEMGNDNNPTNWQRSVVYYENASELAETVQNGLPSRRRVYAQIIAVLVGVVGLLGAIAGILSLMGVTISII